MSLSDPDPSYAPSPSDRLCRSTMYGRHSSNVPARRLNPADGRRLRGCVRPCRGSLCPTGLRLFRSHDGICLFHRHAQGVPREIAKAPPPLELPLLFFQIVDSRPHSSLFAMLNSQILRNMLWVGDIVHPVLLVPYRYRMQCDQEELCTDAPLAIRLRSAHGEEQNVHVANYSPEKRIVNTLSPARFALRHGGIVGSVDYICGFADQIRNNCAAHDRRIQDALGVARERAEFGDAQGENAGEHDRVE